MTTLNARLAATINRVRIQKGLPPINAHASRVSQRLLSGLQMNYDTIISNQTNLSKVKVLRIY